MYCLLRTCRAESHKENSQPDVQGVEDEGSKQSSLRQVRRTLSSHSNGGHQHHEAAAAAVKRPSIFESVALLAESSSMSPSRSVRQLPSSSASVFTVTNNMDKPPPPPPFVTPPYTPRSRYQHCPPSTSTSQPAVAAPSTLPPQPLATPGDDVTSSLMTTTPSSMTMTPDDRYQRQRVLHMTYTPPFTPLRPSTTTPVHGHPRSRLSLNCATSSLHDLTRPPAAASLTVVSGINLLRFVRRTCTQTSLNLLKFLDTAAAAATTTTTTTTTTTSLTGLFSGDHSGLVHSRKSPKDETGDCWYFFLQVDVIPVTQPTVSC